MKTTAFHMKTTAFHMKTTTFHVKTAAFHENHHFSVYELLGDHQV